MSFEDRIAAKCITNIRRDIEETGCIAMSDTGFLTLRDDMERRHSEAACLHKIAVDNLRHAEEAINEVQPVMDLVYAIGCMRDVAAEFAKTPADIEDNMRYILQSSSLPLNSDNCANRLRDMLLDRETPEEREAREESDYVDTYAYTEADAARDVRAEERAERRIDGGQRFA